MLRFLSQVLQRLEVSRCRKIETLILSLCYTKFLEPPVQSHQTKVISCCHALQIHSLLTSITFIFCALPVTENETLCKYIDFVIED